MPRRNLASTAGVKPSKASRTDRRPSKEEGGRMECSRAVAEHKQQCNLNFDGMSSGSTAQPVWPSGDSSGPSKSCPKACRSEGSIRSESGSEPKTSWMQTFPRPKNSSSPSPPPPQLEDVRKQEEDVRLVLRTFLTSMTSLKPLSSMRSRAMSARTCSASMATTFTLSLEGSRFRASWASSIESRPVPAPMSRALTGTELSQSFKACWTAAA
mmetsp:Transcript_57256/g.121724  ORF Transcript_57256/g.121724 Transcript_57256/m.121724 type:complete len:212 (+) Transcript_57256:37-672(+)